MSPRKNRSLSRATPAFSPPVAAPAETVKISSLIDAGAVLIAEAGWDKPAALKNLIGALKSRARGVSVKQLLQKVLERDSGISTTLDTGLSLPHARIDGLEHVLAGLVIFPRPIPDPNSDGLMIKILFLFFSPNRSEDFARHLKILRAVAGLFQPALIEKLALLRAPAVIAETLRMAEG